MKMMCWFARSIHVVLLNWHFVSSLWRNELSESTSCFPPGNALDALRPRVGFIAGGNICVAIVPKFFCYCHRWWCRDFIEDSDLALIVLRPS